MVTNLVAALRAVVDVLEEANTPYLIVGSVAAAAWGVARSTRDVDIVAVLSEHDVDVLITRLGEDFYVPEEHARRVAAAAGGSFNVLHTSSGGKVDVFVARSDDEFTRSRLARRIRSDVLGVATWVATAEDVVLAKLRWRIDTRSEVQWRDCVEIVASNPLDRSYLRAWAEKIGVVDDLNDLVRSVDRS